MVMFACETVPTPMYGESLLASALYDTVVEEISSKDLEHLEDALEQVADEKKGLKLEQQDLDALKEDVHEYHEVSRSQPHKK